MTDSSAPMWFDALTEEERRECAAELTDAYFVALSEGAWSGFQSVARLWLDRSAARQLVTA